MKAFYVRNEDNWQGWTQDIDVLNLMLDNWEEVSIEKYYRNNYHIFVEGKKFFLTHQIKEGLSLKDSIKSIIVYLYYRIIEDIVDKI